MLVADPPFNVISPTSPYLAMWDTVQTKSSDRIYRGSCVYMCETVCMRKCRLDDEVCVCTEAVCLHTLVCVRVHMLTLSWA